MKLVSLIGALQLEHLQIFNYPNHFNIQSNIILITYSVTAEQPGSKR